jgi:two-component system, sensor histidine kinase YesM
MNSILKYKKSIISRLLLLSTLIIIIPVTLLGIGFYYRSINIAMQDTYGYTLDNFKNVSNNVDKMLGNIEYQILALISDEKFISEVKKMKTNETISNYSDYTVMQDLINYVFRISRVDLNIFSVYLYNPQIDVVIASDGQRIINDISKKDDNWYSMVTSLMNESPNWFPVKTIDKIGTNKYVLSYFINLNDFKSDKKFGMILTNVDELTISKQINKSDLGKNGYSFIISNSGFIISHKNKELIGENAYDKNTFLGRIINSVGEGYYECSIDGVKSLVVYYYSSIYKWKYVAVVPLNEISRQSDIFRIFIIILYILFCVLLVLGGVLISRQLYKPIKMLVDNFKNLENGDFTYQMQHNRVDEFGYVFDQFNNMILKLKDSINEIYTMKLLNKEAELKALQSQLDEHFLYNVFDTIYWMSNIYKINDLSKIILSLSKYFRLNLNGGKDIITVDEVVQLIVCYMDIQKIRHKNKFDYVINVDDSLKNSLVLKHLFQPLVENAILHGIEQKRGRGNIDISFTKEESNIRFSISDNGVGISNMKLQQILKYLNDDFSVNEENFALRNINAQIKLFYGKEYSMQIFSSENEGTQIILVLPIIDPGEGHAYV